MPEILTRFESLLKALGKSEGTINTYMIVAREFLQVVGEKKKYAEKDVIDFLIHQSKKEKQHGNMEIAGMKGTYLRLLIYSLKALYRCLGQPWTFKKEDMPKLGEFKRPYYNIDEMSKILDTIKKTGNTRDWLMFRVLSLAFSRRKSISLLRRNDYDPVQGTIMMPSVKHGRRVVITLDAETKEALGAYLTERKDKYPALFLSGKSQHSEGQIYPGTLNNLLTRYSKLAGVPDKGMHAWRRGMVTYLYEQGLREREIFEMGDWLSEDMVSTYVRLSPNFAQETRNKYHPFYKAKKVLKASSSGER